jgi:hypothetical protein
MTEPLPPGYGTTPPLPPGYTQGAATVPDNLGELALKRSVTRAVLCTIASAGIYQFFWFYQYRRRISAELGKTNDAGIHTAGLIVPFLNLYLVYVFWTDVSAARQRVGLTEVPAPTYLILSIIPFVSLVTWPVCCGLVAQRLNEYWDARTAGTATDAPFSSEEKLVTFLPMVVVWGSLALVLGLVALVT